MQTYLQPINSNCQSFYKKAKTEQSGNIISLISYSTIVASYNIESEEMTIKDWYSTTTARHINEFLTQYGFPKMNKAEMIKNAGKTLKKLVWTIEKEILNIKQN
jgi:N-acetylglutamate synthase-like GNAT family acetyltransferase